MAYFNVIPILFLFFNLKFRFYHYILFVEFLCAVKEKFVEFFNGWTFDLKNKWAFTDMCVIFLLCVGKQTHKKAFSHTSLCMEFDNEIWFLNKYQLINNAERIIVGLLLIVASRLTLEFSQTLINVYCVSKAWIENYTFRGAQMTPNINWRSKHLDIWYSGVATNCKYMNINCLFIFYWYNISVHYITSKTSNDKFFYY